MKCFPQALILLCLALSAIRCSAESAFDGMRKSRCIAGENIAITSEWLEDIASVLPNIPPEEKTYLESQKKAMEDAQIEEWGSKTPTTARSSALYRELTSRPLYLAWVARTSHAKAKDMLDKLMLSVSNTSHKPYWPYYLKNPAADQLDRAAGALPFVGSFVLDARAYAENYRGAVPLFSSTRSEQRFWGATLMINSQIAYFIQCKLVDVVGPNGL